MSRTINPGCRLSVLRARDGRSAVIFRRGPNRHVLMIRWWLASDTFETGTLTTKTAAPLDGAEVIADFTDLKFAAVEAPPSARRWP
jgi:hypothetical protein